MTVEVTYCVAINSDGELLLTTILLIDVGEVENTSVLPLNVFGVKFKTLEAELALTSL